MPAAAATVLLLLLALGIPASQAQLRGLPGLGGGGGSSGLGAPGVGAPAIGTPGIGVPDAPQPPVRDVPRTLPGVQAPALSNSITDPLVRPRDTTTNTLSGPVRDLSGTLPQQLPGAVANPAARQGQRRVSGVPPAGERRFVSDEVVVSLPSNLSREAINELARRHRLTLLDSQPVRITGRTYHRWRIGDGRRVPDVIRALERDGGVSEAQPSYRFALQEPASLPPMAARDTSIQYSLGKLQIPQAHRFAAGNGVLVAIIDSGNRCRAS